MTASWKRSLIPFSVVPILLLLAYGFRTDPRVIPSPLIEKAAPPFSLSLFDGGHLSLDGLRGKVVVVNLGLLVLSRLLRGGACSRRGLARLQG